MGRPSAKSSPSKPFQVALILVCVLLSLETWEVSMHSLYQDFWRMFRMTCMTPYFMWVRNFVSKDGHKGISMSRQCTNMYSIYSNIDRIEIFICYMSYHVMLISISWSFANIKNFRNVLVYNSYRKSINLYQASLAKHYFLDEF